MGSHTWRVIAILLPLVLGASPSLAARMVVFGDSWGVPVAPALQQVLIDHGLPDTVAGAAVDGETATDLSSPSGLQHLTNTLSANPDADLVHLSIGGNDFLGSWNANMPGAQEAALFDAILADVETIVDHVLALRPEAEILWSSYDYPRPLALGTPAQLNAASARFGALAIALADAVGAGLSYVDFSGLMQLSFGFDGVQYTSFDPPLPIPPGDPSLPDPNLPGPDAAYTDPIHLTAAGYAILAQAQFDSFYAARLAPPGVAVPALHGPMQALQVGLMLAAGAMASSRRLRDSAKVASSSLQRPS